MFGVVVPMELVGVRVEVPANTPVVILREQTGAQRLLPIVIGTPEASSIHAALEGIESPRPLTHDLMTSIFDGFGITVERVVITELKNSTYFARLILQQQNELGRKIVEIDARPSDCIALATAQKKPIYVAAPLFEEVEDMSELLERIHENGGEAEA